MAGHDAMRTAEGERGAGVEFLPAALTRPECYPHPVREIRLLETHISWVLLAAEILYSASKFETMPRFLSHENERGVPSNALWLTNIVVQVFLILTLFTQYAFRLALELTSSMILIPYFLVAAYGLKLAYRGETYDRDPSDRRANLVQAGIATIYTAGLIYAAGAQHLLLTTVIYGPGTILYILARREQGARVFTLAELVLFSLAVLGACAFVTVFAMSFGSIAVRLLAIGVGIAFGIYAIEKDRHLRRLASLRSDSLQITLVVAGELMYSGALAADRELLDLRDGIDRAAGQLAAGLAAVVPTDSARLRVLGPSGEVPVAAERESARVHVPDEPGAVALRHRRVVRRAAPPARSLRSARSEQRALDAPLVDQDPRMLDHLRTA